MNKIISVIIPSYKPSKYIFELLDSLYSQTIDKALFEIIIILNGPHDPYYNEISSYFVSKGSTIDYSILYSDWGNVSNARNMGLDHAKGEYIAFVDDDDVITPNYLEILLSKSDKETVAISNTTSFVNDIEEYLSNHYTDIFKKNINTDPTEIFRLRSFLSPVAFKLIHKNIVGSIKYDTKFRNGQDSVFMFEISKNIKKMILCSDAYYYIRVRENSASHTQSLKMVIIKSVKLLMKFTGIYFSDFTKYNLKLYFSRIVASILWIFRYNK